VTLGTGFQDFVSMFSFGEQHCRKRAGSQNLSWDARDESEREQWYGGIQIGISWVSILLMFVRLVPLLLLF